jgi:hypothetical protein
LVGIVEAVSAFDIHLEQIRVLSIGCGDSHRPFGLFKRAAWASGMWFWRDAVFTAMRLQSQSALGQAKHLIGPEDLVRVDVRDPVAAAIDMDDYTSAARLLPDLGDRDLDVEMRRIGALLGLEAEVA